ncbi:uncharacterized protein LOC144643438 isoform X2 [Oculina patagonica]
MELEFFRNDVNEDCKLAGPTLAELNDHRSLSPLINPEMERLHRIATRAEDDCSPSWDCTTTRKPQPYIALELTSDKTEKRVVQLKKEPVPSNCENSERFEQASTVLKETEKKLPSRPTWTLTRDITSLHCKNEAEKTVAMDDGKSSRMTILPEKNLSHDGINQMPKLVSAEMKTRLYTEGAKVERDVEAERDSIEADPSSPAVDDESADEDMDSDDDFDVENHLHGAGLARNRKGRRGEHDDLSPNPRKLLEISRELDRLNKVIGDLKPIHQLPQNARNKSRKEKNKLASRACRLKKKAQHEANKVKLQGLELEQQRLTEVIDKVKKDILLKGSSQVVVPKANLSGQVEALVKATFGNQLVAGHTSDFVHSVLKATARANPSLGELDELSLCSF